MNTRQNATSLFVLKLVRMTVSASCAPSCIVCGARTRNVQPLWRPRRKQRPARSSGKVHFLRWKAGPGSCTISGSPARRISQDRSPRGLLFASVNEVSCSYEQCRSIGADFEKIGRAGFRRCIAEKTRHAAGFSIAFINFEVTRRRPKQPDEPFEADLSIQRRSQCMLC